MPRTTGSFKLCENKVVGKISVWVLHIYREKCFLKSLLTNTGFFCLPLKKVLVRCLAYLSLSLLLVCCAFLFFKAKVSHPPV